MRPDQVCKSGVGEIVGMDHEEVAVAKPVTVGEDRASRTQQFCFVDEIDSLSPGGGGDELLHQFMEIVRVDEHLFYSSVVKEGVQPIAQHWLAMDGDEALGDMVGQRPQTRPKAGGQKKRSHMHISSRTLDELAISLSSSAALNGVLPTRET